MSRVLPVGLFLLLVLGGGAPAGPAGPAPAGPAPAAPAGEGRVTIGIEVKSAVYLWREHADDLTLMLSDAPDLCGALRAGQWPGSATILTALLKHNTPANRDDPFRAGDYPLRREGAPLPQDTKSFRLVSLSSRCVPRVRFNAASGVVRLSTPSVATTGTAEGSFDVVLEGGARMEGKFKAQACEMLLDQEPSGCR